MPQLHDEAADEFAEAAAYYEGRLVGLGGRFIREVQESLSRIDEAAEAGSLSQAAGDPAGVRRMPVRSFPYHLVYLTTPLLVVVAVAHDRQRPGYWQGRLST